MTDSQGSIEIFNHDATNIDDEHDDEHLTSMKSALLAPFLEFLNPSSGSSNSSASANSENNNIANKVALMAHCLVDEQFTAL